MFHLKNTYAIIDGDEIELTTQDGKVVTIRVCDGMIAGTIDGEGVDLYLSEHSLEEAATKLLT